MGNASGRKPCRECGKMIDVSLMKCFSCGADQRGFFAKYYIVVGVIIALLIGAAGGSALFYFKSPTEQKAPMQKQDIQVDDVSVTVSAEADAASEAAVIYAVNMYMSERNVRKQLMSEFGENLSPEDLEYAMSTLTVDWKNNAFLCARLYKNGGTMTPSEIYDQLIAEDKDWFTEEEARYAIENLK